MPKMTSVGEKFSIKDSRPPVFLASTADVNVKRDRMQVSNVGNGGREKTI